MRGYSLSLSLSLSLPYSIVSTEIIESNIVKDLVVWVDNRLSVSEHITKVSFSLNFFSKISRTFYKILIRPKLEYASVVWSPYLKSDIARLGDFSVVPRFATSTQTMYLSFLWKTYYSVGISQ